MRYWLVMPAAGKGRRFGDAVPKQYAPLHGRTVIEWALAPFLGDSRCAGAVVAVAASDPHWARIARALPKIVSATGGAERSASVRSGLAALAARAANEDWVLVHDAARPCVGSEDIDRLLERVHDHPVGGLLAAVASDTLKRAGGTADGPGRAQGWQEVKETVNRSHLWRALTPQMFRYGRLCEALDRAAAAGRLPTDEAQALEWLGDAPLLVEGSSANIKVTTADDLLIATALLGARADTGSKGGAR